MSGPTTLGSVGRGPLYRHLVALGSSFAAGPGIAPMADGIAMRSRRNYPHLLAERLSARLTDLTVSGATIATILDRSQRILVRTYAPQLEGVPPDADLVTVTAGGNDLNYVGSIMRIAVARRLALSAISRPLAARLARGAPATVTAEDVERSAAGLAQVVEAVRARTAGARVLLVDYLAVVGPQTRWTLSTPFDDDDLSALRALGKQLQHAFALAAERSGAELIPMSMLSSKHALGSSLPWLNGLQPLRRMTSSFHPNAVGMQAVADAIYRVVSA